MQVYAWSVSNQPQQTVVWVQHSVVWVQHSLFVVVKMFKCMSSLDSYSIYLTGCHCQAIRYPIILAINCHMLHAVVAKYIHIAI